MNISLSVLLAFGSLSTAIPVLFSQNAFAAGSTSNPTVTSPASAITVSSASYSISGTVADSSAYTIDVYSDADNNGSVNSPDAIVATVENSSIAYSIPTPLSLGDNNFLVIATKHGKSSSAAVNVPTITYEVAPTDSTAPTGLSHVSPIDNFITTTAGLTSIDWTDAIDSSGPVSYYYESSHLSDVNLDGSFVSPAYTSGALISSEIPTTGTPEGVYYWHVRAVDSLGNSTSWTSPWMVTIDNTAPVAPTLVSPANNAIVNGASVTQSWSTVDTDVDYYIYESYHDAGATSLRWHQELSATSKTATNVADTTYWWRVKAVDHAGSVSDWSNLWKLTVDSTIPYVEITNPTGSLFNTDVDVRVTATDENLHHYWVKITKNGTTVYNHTTNSTGVTDYSVYLAADEGEYEVTLAARDSTGGGSSTGNRSEDVVKSFTIDKTKPSVAITSPTHGSIQPGSFTVEGIASDVLSDIDGVEYTVTKITGIGGTYVANVTGGTANYTGGVFDFDVAGLTTGFYRLKVQAFDNAGNWRYKYVDVHVDTQKPNASITSPTHGSFQPGDFSVTGTTIDAISGIDVVEYTVNEITSIGGTYVANVTSGTATYGSGSFSFDVAGLTTGYYRLKIKAIDNMGNWRHKYIDVAVDTSNPTATLDTIDSFISGVTTFSGTASDAESGLVSNGVKLRFRPFDGGILQPATHVINNIPVIAGVWTTDFDTALIADGEYRIIVVATDNIGNKGRDYQQIVVIDNTDPVVILDSIVSPTGGSTDVVTITGSADDTNIVSYQLTITDGTDTGVLAHVGGAITNVDWDISTLASGDYTVTLEATDAAGNTSSTSQVVSVDNDNPVVTITGSDVTLTEGDAYTEQGATWTDNLDGTGAIVDITGTVDVNTPGTYVVTYTYTDTVGNEGTATRTVTVEEAPVVLGVNTTNNTNNSGDGGNTPEDSSEESDILGTEDNGSPEGQTDVEGAQDTNSEEDGAGMAWYWWLLALGGSGFLLWLIIARMRKTEEE